MLCRRTSVTLLGLAVAGLLIGPAVSSAASPPANGRLDVTVVSSLPEHVTGGDARLHVDVPPSMQAADVAVLVNGVDQRDRFSLIPGTRTLTGVVDGLVLGDNTVEVRRDNPAAASAPPAAHPHEPSHHRAGVLRARTSTRSSATRSVRGSASPSPTTR
jgi:hypothetical protein